MDIDIEQVKELVRLMVDNELSELDITEADSKIRLRRGPSGEVVMTPVPMPPGHAAPPPPPQHPEADKQEDKGEQEENLLEITSPMVGTFYASESPETGPFVAVGETVSADSVVCIIEAMKVMNEIKADCAGQIVEICVANAQPVEYGHVLFRVRPA